MSLKGGYKIIDLKGVDVTQSTMMIEGIYESIESNYGKPLLISGIVIDGVEKDDVFVQVTLNGSAYEFEVYGYTIQVQDTDAVGIFKLEFTGINNNTFEITPLKINTLYNITFENTEFNYISNCLIYVKNYNDTFRGESLATLVERDTDSSVSTKFFIHISEDKWFITYLPTSEVELYIYDKITINKVS